MKINKQKFLFTDGPELNMNNLPLQMGMKDLFSEKASDLSGITGNRQLFISQVIHNYFLEVNETGTEAAAATCTPTLCTSCKTFIINVFNLLVHCRICLFYLFTIQGEITFLGLGEITFLLFLVFFMYLFGFVYTFANKIFLI